MLETRSPVPGGWGGWGLGRAATTTPASQPARYSLYLLSTQLLSITEIDLKRDNRFYQYTSVFIIQLLSTNQHSGPDVIVIIQRKSYKELTGPSNLLFTRCVLCVGGVLTRVLIIY